MNFTLHNLYIILFYGFSIFLSYMLIVIVYRKMFPLKEGLDIGKSITKAFQKPVNEIKKGTDKIGNSVKGGFDKALGGIEKVFKDIQKIGIFLGDVFKAIGSYLECGAFYVKNFFSYCILYYALHIAGFVFYAPFAFLFWLVGLGDIEKEIWSTLGSINDIVIEMTDINIETYLYPKACYHCELKSIPKLKL